MAEQMYPTFQLRNDGQVEYSVQGEGIPLIFITGIIGVKGPLHLYQVPFLSQFCQVITYDLRSSITGGKYTISLLATDLKDLMDYLEIEQAIICGQSYGALIALQFALDHPGRVMALIVANGFAHYSFEHFGFNSTTLLNLVAMPATTLLPRPLAERAGRFFAKRHIWIYDEVDDGRATIDFAMTFLRSGPSRVIPRRIKSILTFDVRSRLPAVSAPTLIIAGGTDTYCSPVWSEDMARSIPGARLEVIRGAGHLCCLSTPGRFNQIIEEFLSSLEM